MPELLFEIKKTISPSIDHSNHGRRNILVFAGPSGGHLFPALAFAEKFSQEYPSSSLTLVTSRRGQTLVERMPEGAFRGVYYLPEFPSPSDFSWRTLRFLFRLLQAFFLSVVLIRQIKPELSVGFGSFVSYPGMLVSRFFKIPTLIHEQNFHPGRATEWLAPHMDGVAVTFEETLARQKLKQWVVTGLPLRSFLEKAAVAHQESGQRSRRGSAGPENRFTILVVGGSQGAKRLNEVALECFRRLTPEEKQEIAVIHITGQRDFSVIKGLYEVLGMRLEIYPFFEKMDELYGRSDLALTRAGANTLFELALFKVPAAVIPYPHAGSHQEANADFFKSHRAVFCEREGRVNGEWLLEVIRTLRCDPHHQKTMSWMIGNVAKPGAAEKLAHLAGQLLEKKILQ